MISALPLLLARRTGAAIDAVAGDMGLFAAPCAALGTAPGGVPGAGPAVHAALTALSQDSDIGARMAGELIRTPFQAEVSLYLMGPETPVTAGATLTPPGTATDGRDLMLSVALDALLATGETGAEAQDKADILIGGRRLSALWRLDGVTAIAPDMTGTRATWRIDAGFRGEQTLSPAPAEGGHILQIDLSGSRPDGRMIEAGLQATTDDLPVSVLRGIGPENANQLAAHGIVKLVDILGIPALRIQEVADQIAAPGSELNAAIQLLHMILDARRTLLLGGVNAALLDEPYQRMRLDQVWDGTTLTLPPEMPADQVLRFDLLARPLLSFLTPDAWARLTLGQLSTAKGEG